MALNLIQNSDVITQNKEVGRNNPCICGSGKKYKRCCLNRNKTLNTFYMGRNFTVEFSIYAIDDLVNLHLKELSISLIKEEDSNEAVKDGDYINFQYRILDCSPEDCFILSKAFKASPEYELFKCRFNDMTKDKGRLLEVVFPKNHKNKLLKGKTLKVEAWVTSIKTIIEPTIEEIAKYYGYLNNEEMIDNLKEEANIFNNLEKTFSAGEQVIKHLIKEVPKKLTDDLVADCFNDFMNLIKKDNPSLKSSKKDREDFIFSFLEQTFCETIAQDQKIKMSVINYKNEMGVYSKLFKAVQLGYKQVIYEEDLKSIVTSMFKRLDVYKFLVENNNLTYKYKELAMVEKS